MLKPRLPGFCLVTRLLITNVYFDPFIDAVFLSANRYHAWLNIDDFDIVILYHLLFDCVYLTSSWRRELIGVCNCSIFWHI